MSAAIEHYLSESWSEFPPRYYVPDGNRRSKISESRKPESGRALFIYGDPGYGDLVRQSFQGEAGYCQEMVKATRYHIEDV